MDFNYIKEYLSDFDLVKSNFLEVLKNCFNFAGRLNRTKFFTFSCGLSVISIILSALCVLPVVGRIFQILAIILPLIYCVILIGPTACRLRDAGYSPWHLLWYLTFFFSIVPCVLVFFKSKDAEAAAPAAETPAEENK